MTTKTNQHSDSLIIGCLLFFIGGFQNGYTYFCRGGVFANLQTGNMIFLAHTIAFEQAKQAIHYLIPLLAFGLGIFIATRHRLIHHGRHHWRSHLIMVETILVMICGLITASHNDIANALISFNAGMNVSAFQHFHGYPMASTMMIGNFKAIMTHLATYTIDHTSHHLAIASTIVALLLVFLLGATIATVLIPYFDTYTIWFIIPLLVLTIIWMERPLPQQN